MKGGLAGGNQFGQEAATADCGGKSGANGVLVFNDEDASGGHGRLGGSGQQECDTGTGAILSIAPLEVAAMSAADVQGDGEAEAHAALALGKKGATALGQCRRRKTRTRVFDGQRQRRILAVKKQADRAAGRRGLDGIQNDVGQSLVETVPVSHDDGVRIVFTGNRLQEDQGVGGLGLQELACPLHEGKEVHWGEHGRRGAREMEPLGDQAVDAGGFAIDEVLRVLALAVCGALKQLDMQADGGERVADLVSEASGHLTQESESFGLSPAVAFDGERLVGGVETAGQFSNLVRTLRGERWQGLVCGE